MALCDFLIKRDIAGYDCSNQSQKGVKPDGLIINRADIDLSAVTFDDEHPFLLEAMPLKSGKVAYDIVQSGKTPFNGTQQELVEGTYQNTFTNTYQFVILKQDATTAEMVFNLMNGEFVAVLKNNNGTAQCYAQVYGLEAGLHASAIVRELYNDDTLSGWLVTMTEENAPKGSIFMDDNLYESLKD